MHNKILGARRRASAEVIFDLMTVASRNRIAMSQAPITPKNATCSERAGGRSLCQERQAVASSARGRANHPTLLAGVGHHILLPAPRQSGSRYLVFALGAGHMCRAGAIRGGPRPSRFGFDTRHHRPSALPKPELPGSSVSPIWPAPIAHNGKGFPT